MEAAEGLAQVSGMQGEMQGYMRMMNALEDRFPNLLDAVQELTEGCGRIDLHWRPTNPNFSRLYIDFDCDFRVKLFHRLTGATTEAAREAVRTVMQALPEGKPYPNRPNTVTGLVGFKGQCVGVRATESLGEGPQRRLRQIHLLPESRDDRTDLMPEEAVGDLLQVFGSPESGPN